MDLAFCDLPECRGLAKTVMEETEIEKTKVLDGDLERGQCYVIRFEDCCVVGEFKARFLGWSEDGLLFDVGELMDWAGVSFWKPKTAETGENLGPK